jgi:hypothetical protein
MHETIERSIAMPETLQYARNFFVGGHRWRSAYGYFRVGIALAILTLSYILFIHAPDVGYYALLGMIAGGIFLGFCIVRVVGDHQDGFIIGSDGIWRGRKFVRWDDVGRIGAYGRPDSESVTLFFTHSSGGGQKYQVLGDPRPMSPAEYERLIAVLGNVLGSQYPRLKLGGFEDPS